MAFFKFMSYVFDNHILERMNLANKYFQMTMVFNAHLSRIIVNLSRIIPTVLSSPYSVNTYTNVLIFSISFCVLSRVSYWVGRAIAMTYEEINQFLL